MTGVLLIQLGTPEAPTAGAVRPYLRQFLADRRVIDVPRLKWWLILNLFILPFRPRQSAAKYARIWDPTTGSPLLHHTRLPDGGAAKTAAGRFRSPSACKSATLRGLGRPRTDSSRRRPTDRRADVSAILGDHDCLRDRCAVSSP